MITMPRKKFAYKGKDLDELSSMSFEDFLKLLPARQRRTINRGFSEAQKNLIREVRSVPDSERESAVIRTHCRDFVVLPEMVGLTLEVYDGQDFKRLDIKEEMIGHYLGEFVLTRKRVQHSAPGVGATRSSKYVPLK